MHKTDPLSMVHFRFFFTKFIKFIMFSCENFSNPPYNLKIQIKTKFFDQTFFFLQNLIFFVCLGKVCLPEAGPCSRRTSKAGALPYQDKTYWFSWQSNERVLRLEEKTLNYFFFLTIKTLLQELSLNFESLYLCNPIF